MTRQDTIPYACPSFFGKEAEYLLEAFRSTWISGGAYVDRFEQEFRRYCGTPFALTASNGTAALHMAYLALGIGPGDEVIVPGFGFLAAAHMAIHMGATPVFVEVDARTWCLSSQEVEAAISPQTKAIVPVHTYGNVCDMDDLAKIGAASGIPIVEDAAEALSSRHKARLTGTMGTMGIFSFQATKTITTGEGGMVVTREKELHDRMALYRSHGMLRKRYYWHEVPGHNFRLTNLQAALGCAQLEQIDRILRERRRVHQQYGVRLAEVSGLTMQYIPPEVDPILWAVAVRLDPKAFPQGRDAVMKQMRERKTETRNGFFAPSLMPGYRCRPLPVCEELSRQVISLPTFPTLSSAQIEYICDTLKSLQS
jgi:perosamine synthetase